MAQDLVTQTYPGQPKAPDTLLILRDRLRGLNMDEIGAKYGVSASAISQRLGRLADLVNNPEQSQAFTEHRADILDSVSLRVVGQMLNEKALGKASINNLAYAARQLYDMSRLERGESTANVSQLTAIIQAAHAKRQTTRAHDITPSALPDIVPLQDVIETTTTDEKSVT